MFFYYIKAIKKVSCIVAIHLVLFVGLTNLYGSEKIEFVKLDNRQGFSSDNITDVIQDTEGYLWFTTTNGINRYDGYNIKVYKPSFERPNGFSSHDFTCITLEGKDKLWFGTVRSGVNVYDKKLDKITRITSSDSGNVRLTNNFVNDLHTDSKGRVWIACNYGLNRYDPDSETMHWFTDKERFGKKNPKGVMSNIYENKKGEIFISSYSGRIYRFDEGTEDFIQMHLKGDWAGADGQIHFYTMLSDKNYYWLGTWENGLIIATRDSDTLKLFRKFQKFEKSRQSLTSNIIYTIHKVNENEFWIGTPFRLNVIRNPYSIQPEISNIAMGQGKFDLSGNEISKILKDRSGTTWITTNDGGVNKVSSRPRQFQTYLLHDLVGFPESQIFTAFAPYKNGELLVGSQGVGFGSYRMSDGEFRHYSKLPIFDQIKTEINTAKAFLTVSEKLLWIGTRYRGVLLINMETGEVEQRLWTNDPYGYYSRQVNSMVKDSRGNVWVGTASGLYRFTYSQSENKYVPRLLVADSVNNISLEGKYINAVFEDSKGRVWVATAEDGLIRVENPWASLGAMHYKQFRVDRSDKNTIRSDRVYYIAEDSLKQIWVATADEGLALFNENTSGFRHFDTEIGLESGSVFSIIPVSRTTMWLVTNSGLRELHFSDTISFTYSSYSYDDGLQGNIFFPGAYMIDDKGQVLLGGNNGFNVIRNENLQENTYVPEIAFAEVSSSHGQHNIYNAIENGLQLNHKDKSFTVEFTSFSFTQSHKNQFAYRLSGYQEEWVYTNAEKRSVTFSGIPPGKYVFMLKSANSSGLWKPEILTLQIKIRPHPLKSNLAFVLYGVLVLAVLYIIYRVKINNMKIKQALEIEMINRAKDENVNEIKFRFFTNISHELMTPLSILSCSLEEIADKEMLPKRIAHVMNKNIYRLLNLISQLLDYRKMETGKMVPRVSQVNVNHFISDLCSTFRPLTNKRNIKLELSGSVNGEMYLDVEKMDKIFSNLLSNAYKYSPQGGVIRINYELKQINGHTWLQAEVIDSGKGINPEFIDQVFERFFQVKSVTGKTFGAGIGLALSRSLVEVLEGKIWAENVNPNGAKFVVQVPVSKGFYADGKQMDEVVVYDKEVQPYVEELIDSEEPILVKKTERPEGVPKILIVEDNQDFREVIYNNLSQYYELFVAENGQIGYELAQKENPDLIVSDVMMPVMDGMELCRHIKQNIDTSHIVVILLTAHTGEDARLQSYKAMADSYLSKPVKLKLLHARIEGLLESKRLIIKKFSQGKMPEVSQNQFSDLDNSLIKQIKEVVLENLVETNFGVESLSKSLGYSNSVLYRKLTKLTGMSPVEFIRYIRLQHAAEKLKDYSLTVSEVGYQSGFNDMSYFSKCFKQQFSQTPKAYQVQLQQGAER